MRPFAGICEHPKLKKNPPLHSPNLTANQFLRHNNMEASTAAPQTSRTVSSTDPRVFKHIGLPTLDVTVHADWSSRAKQFAKHSANPRQQRAGTATISTPTTICWTDSVHICAFPSAVAPNQCVCLTNFMWRATPNPKCHVTFSKTKLNVNWHLHFIPKYHLNIWLTQYFRKLIFWNDL